MDRLIERVITLICMALFSVMFTVVVMAWWFQWS
jgi:hypothetical protein